MESSSQALIQVLRNVLTQLPSLLTLLVCLIIALARWKRHPKVSLVAAAGFTFHILHGLFFSAAYIWIPRLFGFGGFQDNQAFFSLLAIVGNCLFAIALAILLTAVFIDRKQTA